MSHTYVFDVGNDKLIRNLRAIFAHMKYRLSLCLRISWQSKLRYFPADVQQNCGYCQGQPQRYQR